MGQGVDGVAKRDGRGGISPDGGGESCFVAQSARDPGGALRSDPGTGGGARLGWPDVRRLQRYGDGGSTQFSERSSEHAVVRQEREHLRRCRASAAGGIAVRWRGSAAEQAGAGGGGRASENGLFAGEREPGRSRADRPRISAAERGGRSAAEHRDRRGRLVAG